MESFKNLGLSQNILDALEKLGYEHPTPIQEIAIPQIINYENDLKAFAQTGTGKTAAFGLPILEMIDNESSATQAIILSPTRELAIQIAKSIEGFSQNPLTKAGSYSRSHSSARLGKSECDVFQYSTS